MEMTMNLSPRGSRRLAEFLSACLSFGWSRSDLDWLQELWERHHDENGAVCSEDSPRCGRN